MQRSLNFLDLYFYSIFLGFEAIGRGLITKESIKRILCPMDPSRFYELPRVGNAMELKGRQRVLDLSSPKLLVCFLAQQYPVIDFYAIEKSEEELQAWQEIAPKLKNLFLSKDDATKLSFPNGYFDKVYSVSVIEHINLKRANGDSKAIKEVDRVLKRGGRFIFTTMISNSFRNEYRDRDIYSDKGNKEKKTFFCRVYDYKNLRKRVLEIKNFRVLKEEVCNYRFPVYESIFNKLVPYSVIYGFLHVIIAPLMIKTEKNMKKINKRAEYFAVLEKRS